mmetsp:Transcript_21964/g.43636  ORF Transcript_21964/g.43636 Transcript_21964/m.43636 type:complete len:288 (+) Transcript_21964:860-1723(+)
MDLALHVGHCVVQSSVLFSPANLFVHPVFSKSSFDGTEEIFEALHLETGITDSLVRIVHLPMPALQQKHHPQFCRRVLLQSLPNLDKIFETFRHLQTLDVKVPCMEKVVDPLIVAVVRFTLCQLIVVVRELEILTTSMNVHVFAHYVTRYHRALDVPAWSAFAPRAVPTWFARLAPLPQDKIIFVFFVTGTATERTFTLSHVSFRGFLFGRVQFSVVMALLLEIVDAEVHGAVALVSKTFVDDNLNIVDDLRNVLSYTSQDIWVLDSKPRHIFHVLLFKFSCVRFEH